MWLHAALPESDRKQNDSLSGQKPLFWPVPTALALPRRLLVLHWRVLRVLRSGWRRKAAAGMLGCCIASLSPWPWKLMARSSAEVSEKPPFPAQWTTRVLKPCVWFSLAPDEECIPLHPHEVKKKRQCPAYVMPTLHFVTTFKKGCKNVSCLLTSGRSRLPPLLFPNRVKPLPPTASPSYWLSSKRLLGKLQRRMCSFLTFWLRSLKHKLTSLLPMNDFIHF